MQTPPSHFYMCLLYVEYLLIFLSKHNIKNTLISNILRWIYWTGATWVYLIIHTVMPGFGVSCFHVLFFRVYSWFLSSHVVSLPSCIPAIGFFVHCVMFWLLALVMCVGFHWLVCVMWSLLFDINSPHIVFVLCPGLSLYLCWCFLVFLFSCFLVFLFSCFLVFLFSCFLVFLFFLGGG